MKTSSQDLLVTDLRGEVFEDARDSIEGCQRLGLLSRADHIVIIVDGAKLNRPDARHEVCIEAETLLRSFLDSGMLGNRALIEIVFSKWDLIEDNPQGQQAASRAEERLMRLYGQQVERLEFTRIAARPTPASGLELGHGVEVLFKRWVEHGSPAPRYVQYERQEPESGCDFDHFQWRRFVVQGAD